MSDEFDEDNFPLDAATAEPVVLVSEATTFELDNAIFDWRKSGFDVRSLRGGISTQWAVLGGLFLPLYGLASGWSAINSQDDYNGSCNVFERLAGFKDGNYDYCPA